MVYTDKNCASKSVKENEEKFYIARVKKSGKESGTAEKWLDNEDLFITVKGVGALSQG